MTGLPQLYFEDFAAGDRFAGPSRTLTDAHFLLFGALTGDNHPVHYDDVYAAQHRFGKRVAHGLLLTAMTAAGGTTLSLQIEESLDAFLEVSARFCKPALVGDTVKPWLEITELVPKSRGRGLVRMRAWIENQDGEELLEGEHVYLIRSREAPPPS